MLFTPSSRYRVSASGALGAVSRPPPAVVVKPQVLYMQIRCCYFPFPLLSTVPALTQAPRLPDRHISLLHGVSFSPDLQQLGGFLEATSESVSDAENIRYSHRALVRNARQLISRGSICEEN